MIIYTHFVASKWRRDYINVITRNSYCNEIQNGRFLFSFLYNRNNRTERSILNPTYSNIEFKKKENCKRTRWIAQAEATARERGDYFIIVECRSLGWAGEKQERGRSCKGEESRFIRFSNLVHQAGCIPSNRVRQIYRGIMQIMHVCPPLSSPSSSPAISSRRSGGATGVARFCEKVNRKVNFRPRSSSLHGPLSLD